MCHCLGHSPGKLGGEEAAGASQGFACWVCSFGSGTVSYDCIVCAGPF